jgi:hypothetical protein
VPPGFDGYQWRKNGVVIANASTNTLKVTSLGTYDARVLRGSIWSDWSHTPVIIQITPPTVTPPITVDGLMSNVLPSGDGKTYVNLQIPDNGYTGYKWKKVGSDSVIGTQRIFTASQTGQYTVAAMQQYGCSSIPSQPFSVINANGINVPDAATKLAAAALSSTQASLNWENNPHPANNETFFEIYRSTSQDGNYSFIGKVPADTLTFKDLNLSGGVTYFYKVRAINNNGAAPMSNIASTTTSADTIPPTAPVNVKIVYTTNSSVSIKWNPSTDNVGVKNYQVYVNGVKSYTTSATDFIINALQKGTQYSFAVRALDSSGNASPLSNIVSAPTVLNGLIYKYYEGYWTAVPDFSKLTPLATGVTANLGLGVARRQLQFGMLWQGFIKIPYTGRYIFKLVSNDGSLLWLNTYNASVTPLVNNDGVHNSPRTARAITNLTAGTYPISIAYFQLKNAKSIKLYWKNFQLYGDTLFHEITNEFFASDYSPSDSAPSPPINVSASALSYNKIKVTWADKSNNETGFQVYRSLKPNLAYDIIFTTGPNVTTYTDSNLAASTKYYYRVNAVNNFGASVFKDTGQAQTLSLPAQPRAPGNLRARALSSSSVEVDWNNIDSLATSFQVFRSESDTLNFKLAAILPALSVSFIDTGLYGNTNYFYKVNAISTTSSSNNKTAISAETRNNPPVLNNPFSQLAVHYGIQTTIKVTATDPDADAITFHVTGFPTFASYVDNGDGTANLIFNPSSLQVGTYPGIRLFARDTSGGQDVDTFNLVVNDNYSPVMDSIANYAMNEGDALTVQLSASDQNAGDVLTWSVSGIPNNYSLVPVSNGKIKLVLNPTYAAAGVYRVQVTVNDGKGGTAIRQFTLTVNEKDPNVIVYLRFKNQDAVGAPWNDITSVNSSNFTDYLNRGTGIGLSMQTTWWASFNEGPQTGNNSGVYPDAVMKDYYYFGLYGGPSTVTSKLTGLDTSKLYNISFYGGSVWSGATNNGTTIYTIGSQSIPLAVQNNTTNTANFNNIRPASDGTITFTMSEGANTPAGYINAIVIKSFYTDSTKPATPTALTAVNVPGKGVQLSWNDVSYNETNYNVYRATALAGPYSLINGTLPFNSTGYLDTAVAGSTQYFYKVQAVNSQKSSDFSNVASVITTDRIPKLNPITSITIKNNQQRVINVTAKDDATDHVTLTASNLPSFVTFTDNGNGTGSFNISPSSGITGTFENVTVTATDQSDSSSSVSFNITVTDQNLTSVYVNFSDGSLASFPWNNFTSWPAANASLSNMYDDNDSLTAISLKLINGFQGNIEGGMQPGNNKGVYPEIVMRTGLYEGSSRIDSIQISGLNKSKKYNFVFFNSHDDGLKGNTNFVINNQTVSLNATHNINTTAQINAIVPDANGQVLIKVSKQAGADYAYLNSLIIQSYDSSQTLFAPGDLRVIGITKQSVSLQWADRSASESGFEIWRANDSNSTYALIRTVAANATTYTDSNLNSGRTYFYTLRAIKTGVQSAFCNPVAATTYSQAIYVNFTYLNGTDAPWNNTLALPEPGLAWNNLLDDTGIPSTISMQETGVFAGLYSAGVTTGNNSGIYPDNVMIDSYGLFPGESATMKISGLNLNKQYDFTFFASSQAGGDVNTTFTVNSKEGILNASLNTNGTVTVYNVVPDENGEVVIGIAPSDPSSQFGLIGALVIQEYSTSSAAIPAPLQSINIVNASQSKVQKPLSAQPDKAQNKVVVYPNPYNSDFTISLQSETEDHVEAELYDINGKLILRQDLGNVQPGSFNFRMIPGQNLTSGVYLLKMVYINTKNTTYIKVLKR